MANKYKAWNDETMKFRDQVDKKRIDYEKQVYEYCLQTNRNVWVLHKKKNMMEQEFTAVKNSLNQKIMRLTERNNALEYLKNENVRKSAADKEKLIQEFAQEKEKMTESHINHLRNAKEELSSMRVDLEKQIREAENEKNKLVQENESMKAKVDVLKKASELSKEMYEKEKKELKKKLSSSKEFYEIEIKKLRGMSIGKALESAKNAFADKLKEKVAIIEELKEKNSVLETSLKNIELNRHKGNYQSLLEKVGRLENSLKEEQEKCKQTSKNYGQISQQNTNIKVLLTSQTEKIEQMTKDFDELKANRDYWAEENRKTSEKLKVQLEKVESLKKFSDHVKESLPPAQEEGQAQPSQPSKVVVIEDEDTEDETDPDSDPRYVKELLVMEQCNVNLRLEKKVNKLEEENDPEAYRMKVQKEKEEYQALTRKMRARTIQVIRDKPPEGYRKKEDYLEKKEKTLSLLFTLVEELEKQNEKMKDLNDFEKVKELEKQCEELKKLYDASCIIINSGYLSKAKNEDKDQDESMGEDDDPIRQKGDYQELQKGVGQKIVRIDEWRITPGHENDDSKILNEDLFQFKCKVDGKRDLKWWNLTDFTPLESFLCEYLRDREQFWPERYRIGTSLDNVKKRRSSGVSGKVGSPLANLPQKPKSQVIERSPRKKARVVNANFRGRTV